MSDELRARIIACMLRNDYVPVEGANEEAANDYKVERLLSDGFVMKSVCFESDEAYHMHLRPTRHDPALGLWFGTAFNWETASNCRCDE